MGFQKRYRQAQAGAISIVLMLGATGCKLGPSSTKDDRKAAVQSQAAAGAANPAWDLNCVYERLQNPPDSFHYTYKHNEVAWEADVTPSTIDGTRTAPEGVRPIHGVRSDTDSWHGAWMNLSAISGMSSTFALVRNARARKWRTALTRSATPSIRHGRDPQKLDSTVPLSARADLKKERYGLLHTGVLSNLRWMWKCI